MSSSLNFNLNNEDELQRLLKMAQTNPDILKKEYEKLLAQNKPVTSKEYLDPNFKPQLDKEGGIVIQPDPGYVIKTREVKSKGKFFINVVTHPIVDEPEEKDFVEYDNETGIRLPMSVGPVKEDFDKHGQICKVVDCIINPNVLKTLKSNNQMALFFYQLINTYLQQKYKIELEETFTLPKLTYKGKSIEFQRVKGKKAPKIQTLSREDHEPPKSEQQKRDEARALTETLPTGGQSKIPEWELYLRKDDGSREEFDGFNEDLDRVQTLEYELYLPLMMTGKNIDLKISEDEIEFKAGRFYNLVLKPLILVDPLTAVARFTTDERKLYILIDKLRKPVEEKEEPAEEVVTEKKTINVPDLSNDMLYDIV